MIRKMLGRGTMARGMAALFLVSAACGGNGGGSQNAISNQSTTITTTPAVQPATTAKSGDFFTVSLTSRRGYKYRATINSLRVLSQPADPGFVNLVYSGRMTIANETPDRKTPAINQVTVILSYDAATARPRHFEQTEASVDHSGEKLPGPSASERPLLRSLREV